MTDVSSIVRLLFTSAAAGAIALGTAAAAPSTAPVVHIKNFAFGAVEHIRVGEPITFVNDDDEAHTVTAVDRSFDSAGLDTHDTWRHVFAKPGVYRYFCALHPYMKGVVDVAPAPTASP